MADISIQFYALPEEQRDFVKQCVSDFGPNWLSCRRSRRSQRACIGERANLRVIVTQSLT
jgi:hypothetical protein